MSCQQIIDEVADDRVRFVAELGHNPANERAAARVPLQIDRAMGILGAVDLGPAVRASGLFRPDFDEAKFLIQLRIAHDLVAQGAAAGRDHLNHRLHPRVDSTAMGAIAIFLSTGHWLKGLLHPHLYPLPLSRWERRTRSASEGKEWGWERRTRCPQFSINQRTEHHVNIDISSLGMPKCAGQCTDDLESQLVP